MMVPKLFSNVVIQFEGFGDWDYNDANWDDEDFSFRNFPRIPTNFAHALFFCLELP